MNSLLQDADTRQTIQQLRNRLNAVLQGKAEVIDQVLVCLLAQGHLLLEDRPGLGKTTLAKALAELIGGKFARVQCTPDLLPGDITGFNIYNQKLHEFEFRRGPVFSDVLLADEINRTTPRTQSALLEAMAERQVTVDAERFPLSGQFFVIATQNPIDQHGTYPLPEAQLDRFTMKLSIGYPAATDELRMLREAIQPDSASASSQSLLKPEQLRDWQEQVRRIAVVEPIQKYLVEVAAATRSHPLISLGLSPRGLLLWQRTAQAQAFLQRRDFVTPDDLQATAVPVLDVRLGIDHDDRGTVLRDLLQSVPVPRYSPV